MQRLLLLMCLAAALAGCGSGNDIIFGNEATLYGAWAKGTSFGDTIFFYKENGKNMMRSSMSFNVSHPNYLTTEYKFANDKLSRKGYLGIGNDFLDIQSFAWKQRGSEFEILSTDIYPFMSALIKISYRKLP